MSTISADFIKKCSYFVNILLNACTPKKGKIYSHYVKFYLILLSQCVIII
jgi:hypothetical protein